MAMSCGQGLVVSWYAARGSVCGSAGASPSRGVETLEFRFAGRGSAICNPGGGRGAITLVECCGGESQIISYTSSLLIVVEIRTDAD